jgi:hypothetical protein
MFFPFYLHINLQSHNERNRIWRKDLYGNDDIFHDGDMDLVRMGHLYLWFGDLKNSFNGRLIEVFLYMYNNIMFYDYTYYPGLLWSIRYMLNSFTFNDYI